MKIIFLDIDGVLNDSNPASFPSQSQRLLRPKEFYNVDDIYPKYIKRLNKIIELTDARIIISSSWRNKYSILNLEMMFIAQGFNYSNYIIGKTCKLTRDLQGNIKDRGDEVSHWLHHNSFPESFIILDDCRYEHFAQFPKSFIYIPDGIEDCHVEQAISVLGTKL